MVTAKVITALLVDSHVVVRSGIAEILRSYAGIKVVGQVGNGEDALRLCHLWNPDVVAMDLLLPDEQHGLDMLGTLSATYPQTRVIVLTNLTEHHLIQQAFQQGALSYILKNISVEELVQTIRAAYEGKPTLSPEVTRILVHTMVGPHEVGYDLTPREQQVLKLIVHGDSNHDIADKLSISLSTVQFHVSNILSKLDVHNRIEAAMIAIQHALVETEDEH